MTEAHPIIRLARTPDFDPPNTPEINELITAWLSNIREALQWLKDDQPEAFNVAELILTRDFVGEVRRQTEESTYQAERASIVAVGKTIRKAGGAVIVLNLDGFPLHNPIAQAFLCLHEGLHARHHRHFNLERLHRIPLPAQRAIGTAESLLDEYACDRLAFQILAQRSGASPSELANKLEEWCLSLYKDVTAGKAGLEARRVHQTYEALYDAQGGLVPEQWSELAKQVHALAHHYWVNAIHVLAFLDEFSSVVDPLQTFDHSTPAAYELLALIRAHGKEQNFDMQHAQATVLTVLSEFGLTYAKNADGQEYVTRHAVYVKG